MIKILTETTISNIDVVKVVVSVKEDPSTTRVEKATALMAQALMEMQSKKINDKSNIQYILDHIGKE